MNKSFDEQRSFAVQELLRNMSLTWSQIKAIIGKHDFIWSAPFTVNFFTEKDMPIMYFHDRAYQGVPYYSSSMHTRFSLGVAAALVHPGLVANICKKIFHANLYSLEKVDPFAYCLQKDCYSPLERSNQLKGYSYIIDAEDLGINDKQEYSFDFRIPELDFMALGNSLGEALQPKDLFNFLVFIKTFVLLDRLVGKHSQYFIETKTKVDFICEAFEESEELGLNEVKAAFDDPIKPICPCQMFSAYEKALELLIELKDEVEKMSKLQIEIHGC